MCWKLIMYVLGPFCRSDPIYSNAVYTIMYLFLDFQSLSSGVLMIMLVHHSETYTCPSPKTKPLSFMFLTRLLPHIHRLQYWELHWKLGRTCTLSFRRAIYNYQYFAAKLVYLNSILKMDTSPIHLCTVV